MDIQNAKGKIIDTIYCISYDKCYYHLEQLESSEYIIVVNWEVEEVFEKDEFDKAEDRFIKRLKEDGWEGIPALERNIYPQMVICTYCGNPAKLVTGKDIYPHLPELAKKYFWKCDDCDAYVGCHPGTRSPLGILANAELRQAKSKAHDVFDRKWKVGGKTRKQAYEWLADELGIDKQECHIGMFDVEMCKKVVKVCAQNK